MYKLKYHLFRAMWLWKIRKWENTRQKRKALERDFIKHLKK